MFTHTWPFPPPGAGVVLVATSPLGVLAPAGLVEVFRLNKSPIFDSELVGDAEADGAAEAVAVDFFCTRRAAGEGEEDGDAVLDGDAACSAFLCVRCFAGEGEVDGVAAGVAIDSFRA